MDPIVQPNALPICVSIPGGIGPNRFLVIDGVVPDQAVSFSVRLQTGPSIVETDDIALYIRFYFQANKSSFSVNSFINKKLGKAVGNYRHVNPGERNLNDKSWTNKASSSGSAYPEVPLRRGDICGLVIDCNASGFHISIKSLSLCYFPHRLDYEQIRYLVLAGDFVISEVGVAGGGPMRWIVRCSGICEPWKGRYIRILTDASFCDDVVRSNEPWLVLLYMEKFEFHNLWEDTAAHLQGKVKVGVLDLLVNLNTALKLGVKESPVVVFYPKGTKCLSVFHKFGGEFTTTEIVKWVMCELNEWHYQVNEPDMGVRPRTEYVVMVERDSWKKFMSTLHDNVDTNVPRLEESAPQSSGAGADQGHDTRRDRQSFAETSDITERRLQEIAARTATELSSRDHVEKLKSNISSLKSDSLSGKWSVDIEQVSLQSSKWLQLDTQMSPQRSGSTLVMKPSTISKKKLICYNNDRVINLCHTNAVIDLSKSPQSLTSILGDVKIESECSPTIPICKRCYISNLYL